MHNGYAHQVEHVRLCAKEKKQKEHTVTQGGIEPQFFTELYSLHSAPKWPLRRSEQITLSLSSQALKEFIRISGTCKCGSASAFKFFHKLGDSGVGICLKHSAMWCRNRLSGANPLNLRFMKIQLNVELYTFWTSFTKSEEPQPD